MSEHSRTESALYQPLDSAVVPRFAGMPTFMRLPVVEDFSQVDVALVGVPFDGGVTNRPGTRHGPRELRNQSSLMRKTHHVTGVSPYNEVRVADCGDCQINPVDLHDAVEKITSFFSSIRSAGARPLTAGGDHLISLPILRGLVSDGPVGMIQFDAHSDTTDSYFGGNRLTHGTPFRRAIEEGLLDPKRVVQIGIRGSVSAMSDFDFAKANGIRIVFIEEFAARGVDDVMGEAREIVGSRPCYVTFDIDAIDPSMAPGTGTPEIGGFTTREAQAMVRHLQGLEMIGADVVEVSPPFDVGGMTAIAGATMMFELLCAMVGSPSLERATTTV